MVGSAIGAPVAPTGDSGFAPTIGSALAPTGDSGLAPSLPASPAPLAPLAQREGNVDGYECGSGSVDATRSNPTGASSCSSGTGPRPSTSPSVRRMSSWM